MVKPKVCLSIIVKNEEAVISRCLRSVRPYIDAAVVVDTGSDDATVAIAKSSLAGIPSRFFRAEWKNFAANRQLALDLARESGCDYALFIDADEILEGPSEMPPLELDAYTVEVNVKGGPTVDFWYRRVLLAKLSVPFGWISPIHERLVVPQGHPEPSHETLAGFVLRPYPDGARARDPERFLRDAEALASDFWATGEVRSAFYCARSYLSDAHEAKARGIKEDFERADSSATVARMHLSRRKARDWFRQVDSMPEAKDQERWCSRYEIANIARDSGEEPDTVIAAYLKATEVAPHRAEAWYDLAQYCRRKDRIGEALRYAAKAAECEFSDAFELFTERSVYAWRALAELAACAHLSGHLQASAQILDHLLDSPALPPSMWRPIYDMRERVACEPKPASEAV